MPGCLSTPGAGAPGMPQRRELRPGGDRICPGTRAGARVSHGLTCAQCTHTGPLCAHTLSCAGTSRQEGPRPLPARALPPSLLTHSRPHTHVCDEYHRDSGLPTRGGAPGPPVRAEQGRSSGIGCCRGFSPHRMSSSQGSTDCSVLMETPL